MDYKRLASNVSNAYIKNPKVEAVLLGGSVCRGWYDKFSDIELYVFWKEEPTDGDRKEPIHLMNGTVIEFYPFEDDEWSETYVAEGVKMEISNFLTSTIQKIMDDVIVEFDTSLDKQCLVAAIHDGIPLYGGELLSTLKKKAAVYPEGLRLKMVRQSIDLGNRWSNREALLKREDWLMLYNVIVSVQMKLMGILFSLNRLYVHHPAFKWQKHSIEMMNIIPENAYQRFASILLNHPEKSVHDLEEMVIDVLH